MHTYVSLTDLFTFFFFLFFWVISDFFSSPADSRLVELHTPGGALQELVFKIAYKKMYW